MALVDFANITCFGDNHGDSNVDIVHTLKLTATAHARCSWSPGEGDLVVAKRVNRN